MRGRTDLIPMVDRYCPAFQRPSSKSSYAPVISPPATSRPFDYPPPLHPPPLNYAKSPYACVPLPAVESAYGRGHPATNRESAASSSTSSPTMSSSLASRPKQYHPRISPPFALTRHAQTECARIDINPLLEFTGQVKYDLTVPPSSVMTVELSQRRVSLLGPATRPARRSIEIISPFVPTSRMIIRASDLAGFVNVADVLEGLRYTLNCTVGELSGFLGGRTQLLGLLRVSEGGDVCV